MALKISSDLERFQKKMKDQANDSVKKFLSAGNIEVPQPDGSILRVPIRGLEIPRFIHGRNPKKDDECDDDYSGLGPGGDGMGGIGQGDGNVGDPLMEGDAQQGSGGTGHGDGLGRNVFRELSSLDIAEILGEELRLPNLLEKFGGDAAFVEGNKYTSISRVGSRSLRHFKRTYRQALKRNIGMKTYVPGQPPEIIRDDERFRSPKVIRKPTTRAAVIHLADRSGSTYEVLPFLQLVDWLADAWIRKHYEKVVHRYVVYDSLGHEVQANEFHTVVSEGGTSINAGLSKSREIAEEYQQEQWNLFLIHYSDGDAHGLEITERDALQINQQMEEYKKFAEEYGLDKSFFDFAEVHAGNPLTDYFIPRCNGIFVCETSQGYFNDDRGYSNILRKLIDGAPGLEKKIRLVAHEYDEVIEHKGPMVKETIQQWFS